MNCKYCNSTNTIKFGTFSGIQRYYYKDCKRKFTALDTLPMMKTPVNEISSAQQKHDTYMRKAVRKSVAKKRKSEPKPSASIQTGRLKK